MMEVEHFLNGRVTLHSGNCLDVLAQLEECSIDSCVTDPPYHLTSIVKRFGSADAAPAKVGATGAYARAAAGFMGRKWDGGDVAFRLETWAKVLRVLKPGGYIVAFSSSRTYHRMACAIEDAGFITHPLIGWVFGTGFPKAHNVSKHIDKMAGAEREVVGRYEPPNGAVWNLENDTARSDVGAVGHSSRAASLAITAAATDAAKQWDGWYYGTQSLKPALEPIYVGQKPFEKGLNGTENILKWGTGAINVGACRVEAFGPVQQRGSAGMGYHGSDAEYQLGEGRIYANNGRWPANVIHDGSEEVVGAFPQSDSPRANGNPNERSKGTSGMFRAGDGVADYRDTGSASRFFYSSKADSDDRLGSKHPTVKPVDLMQYLVRLVTPPGGLVLDPFAGTGTTGEAAWREGMRAVLIEREEEYQADIRRRMALVLAGPFEKQVAMTKANGATESPGPLFESIDYDGQRDLAGSLDEGYRAIRERVAAGGPGWEPK